MGFQIDDPEANRLLAEVAQLTGGTETEAVVRALEDLREKLRQEHQARVDKAWRWLEEEVWPLIPPEVLGKPITKEEREEILGYGPNGYSE